MADTVVDFLLEDLKHILSYNSTNFIIAERDQIESLIKDLEFIRAFLDDSEEKCNDNDLLKLLVTHIQDVSCKTLDDLDSFVCSVLMQKGESMAGQVVRVFEHSPGLKIFEKEIQFIKTKVKEIYDNELYGIGVQEEAIPSIGSLSKSSSPILGEKEIVVGFDSEMTTVKARLVALKQQLQVISIVGMAGLGKTTLATKVYNDPLIVHRFDLRAWICVSQVYRKRDLLFDVLNYIVENKADLYKMKDERLGEELYKRLKGQRYLIVVDDIWNIGAWEDLRRSFPDDKTGSRIMLTTRVKEVALRVNPSIPPHYLRFLTKDESWDLLRKKAFPNENCPLELERIGKEIAAKCQGLPLAIIVVGGLLAKEEETETWWEQVSDRVSSYIVGDAEKKYMDILALSYEHLPHHLRLCFQYFGEFPEDNEISVRSLIRSWIAEGFVKQMGERSLEEIAEEYLMDLVDRSLVLVSKKRSKGGIKACRIHDMLRDLCLSKGKKMNFLQQFKRYKRLVHNTLCFHSHGFHYGISGNVCSAHVGPLLSHVYMKRMLIPTHIKSFIYKLLKVLDLGFIDLSGFPDEVLQLIHLRYLKLHVNLLDRLPPQIQNLWNLETLVIDHQQLGCRVTIPANTWEMVKLRHLRISGKLEFEKPSSNYGSGSPAVLDNLQSLSALPLSHSTEDADFILERTPNLRKLTFHNSLSTLEKISIPDLSNLTRLESLKLTDDSVAELASIPPPSNFPPNLKKLTLSGGNLDWEEISNLGKLPNLEVLKLGDSFFSGTTWKTSEGEFGRLKYLKLSWMDLKFWLTSSCHFPSLQHLVLDRCMYLKEIPSCIGDIPTLDMIEVSWSRRSAMDSARKIQEDQLELGNDGLQVVLVYERFGLVRSKSTYDLQALME